MCSAPQKADKYRQICHPFPPLSPAERLLSWAWFRGPSQTFWKLQWHRAGRNIYFSSPSALLPLLERSWGEEGEEMGLLVPAPAPRRPPLLRRLPPSAAAAARVSGGRRLGTWERSAQLEVAISNYPPISPARKMCFCGGCLPARPCL